MPAFMVTVEAGQVPHAPMSSTSMRPVSSSTDRRIMSPPSAWRAGRMTSIVLSTSSFIRLQCATRDGPPQFPCKCEHMVLAHQGGWDEALFVVVPLVVFGWLLSRAQKRAEREREHEHEHDEQD